MEDDPVVHYSTAPLSVELDYKALQMFLEYILGLFLRQKGDIQVLRILGKH